MSQEEMTTHTYEFQIDPAETIRAGKYIQRRQRFDWQGWVFWPMLFLLAVLYLSTGTPWQELWLLGLVALFVGGVGLVTPWLQHRQLRRAYAESPSLREPQIYRFGDDGLSITGGPATVTLGWDAFLESVETEEFLLLFYSKKCAYYLPKHAIGGGAEQEALRALLRTHLGARASGLRPA